MKIKFSRHAQKRSKLYAISESIIKRLLSNMDLKEGEHEIIREVAGFKYPLKIIVVVEKDSATVITTYPLKKRRKK
ncbi:MAG: DUF4258 domain-containing protein [Candidatus Aureabacteria bacterium]|nr:DUF4258 domain-containing protein [Candidatus Auribacterota bacterium]